MHVDWDWIKQRPHFIAEGLSNFFSVYIFAQRESINKPKELVKNDTKNVKVKSFFTLPFRDKKGVRQLNELLMKIYFKLMIKRYKPDYIWITNPILYNYLPPNLNCKLIYDCMDDAIGFDFKKEGIKTKILESEKELIKKSSIIFVSSNNLATKINKRSKCNYKTFLIRNAFNGNIMDNMINNKHDQNIKSIYKIGYIGTISSWFDFELLEFTLERFKNIEYHIIGPIIGLNNEIHANERIKFYGPINHEKLASLSVEFDCFIMPFKLNKVVESVDPVKFYEFINYNKPVISIFYEEIKRFSPYVYFYSDKETLVNMLEKMIKEGFVRKYSDNQRFEFLKNNSWDTRISKIVECIEKDHPQ